MYSAHEFRESRPLIIMNDPERIFDSPLLRVVEVFGSVARTHSVLMRVKSKTVRSIKAFHDLSAKTLHLRSAGGEVLLLNE